jgi:hypothetical protein
MLAAIEWVRRNLFLLAYFGTAAGLILFAIQERQTGYDQGLAKGQQEVKQLQLEAATQARLAAETALAIIQAQVKRANDAEARLLEREAQLDTARQQLKERIPHVTTVYRPSPTAAPVAIPRCVFTRGWLRDFNAALGAGLPAAGASAAAATTAPAASPAPGSDAELLESGVSPADILAYSQDYGRWSLANLKQLQELLALQVKEAPK